MEVRPLKSFIHSVATFNKDVVKDVKEEVAKELIKVGLVEPVKNGNKKPDEVKQVQPDKVETENTETKKKK